MLQPRILNNSVQRFKQKDKVNQTVVQRDLGITGSISSKCKTANMSTIDVNNSTSNDQVQMYKNIVKKQSTYINKIQKLLVKAPYSEYSNKNLLKMQKQQKEKISVLNEQLNGLDS